jgi:hypothetical protein
MWSYHATIFVSPPSDRPRKLTSFSIFVPKMTFNTDWFVYIIQLILVCDQSRQCSGSTACPHACCCYMGGPMGVYCPLWQCTPYWEWPAYSPYPLAVQVSGASPAGTRVTGCVPPVPPDQVQLLQERGLRLHALLLSVLLRLLRTGHGG